MLFTVLFSACGKEVQKPQKNVDPDDLRYEGLWQGSSSQTKLLWLQIENTDSVPIIGECRIGYLTNQAFKRRFFSSIYGLSEIRNGLFTVPFPDGGSLNGMFISPEICRGKLIIADEYSGELSEVPFTMIKNQSPASIYSAAKIVYEIDGRQYQYVQDDIYFLPNKENINTGTGLLVRSRLQKQATETAGVLPLVTITAGRIASPEDIPKVFMPGEKKYSQNAMDGFEISILYPAEYFGMYTTSNYTGNQGGSSFEIVDFLEVSSGDQELKLYKFSARFNCKVYRMYGAELTVKNGFYIGYIDAGNLK